MLLEESWNAFPYCKSVYSCPFFDKFSMTIVSQHAPDAGQQENILNIEGADLRSREVVFVDIAFDPLDPQYYKPEDDPTLWHSEKKNRGPLAKEWQKTSEPIMTCYKCVRIEFKYTGFQKKVEKYMDGMLRNLMFTFSRQVVCMMDQWADMTEQDVERIEQEVSDLLNKKVETAKEAATATK
eukprot:TRINITY_DN4781_c0_g1_i2.p1 TRINITY_DN4781_c0_g1~~TRINITY_DN4781_c0_g1_i2.p1  ORF type:complete len:182 (-),score=34.24 TRINITY_DN4781_c0_g1_i2:12-557(-)